jgi:hypothetical protein
VAIRIAARSQRHTVGVVRLSGRLAVTVSLLATLLVTPDGAASARAGSQVAGWHVDFLVYSPIGPHDAAAALRWDSTGTVTAFEVDIESARVDLQYLTTDGSFGSFVIWAHVADGQAHRIHLDASQSSVDLDITLTIGGWLAYPFVLPGQRIGAIDHPVINPGQPIRTTDAHVSVDQLSLWSA